MRISNRMRRSGRGGILKLQILLRSGLTKKGRFEAGKGRAVLCRRGNMTGGGGRALALGHQLEGTGTRAPGLPSHCSHHRYYKQDHNQQYMCIGGGLEG